MENDTSVGGTVDTEADVVVVGFGGAGACAAIEAADRGARVLLVDRYRGGGSTARSGGVVYLGGGAPQQKAAGYDDDPEQMARYLAFEVGDAVDETTLRAYCEQSLDHLAFLERLGVPFPASGHAPKTSYPTDDVTLYFSGNELCPPYRDAAAVAPRGFRALGSGLTGNVVFASLRRRAEQHPNITLHTHCDARRLVVDPHGRVTGLVMRRLPKSRGLRRIHDLLFGLATGLGMFSDRIGAWAKRRITGIEERHGIEVEVRARSGVILCAGGFAFNREMVARHAPLFAKAMPLGTAGDDGRGITLGAEAGGALARMERCGAWRFINPPATQTHGLLVDAMGERICNEELYGATLGSEIGYRHGGRAWLVIDARIKQRVLEELREFGRINFQSMTALTNLYVNRTRASTLEVLATLCGMPRDGLQRTIREHNTRVREGRPDPLGKSPGACSLIDTPPYFAIDCSFDSPWFPTPTFTQGGLVVDGASGLVLRDDGSCIEGLYAAGRNAVGISSHSYVSGLSVGDCVFSGRRAGAHAAERGSAT